ncbi:hypothetical protein DVT68_03515 [Dyella solisilvae]|uniref:Uncharacterized protein n=1 Tax=Dyella solisilvae TaxID=1920168 RepID=A0A370KB75_9GAMM|nr:hypothetical protein [Dyella solisilvae]RDI99908.1 hypothetical protein DVT68_03515 [Dyella solisilvae]
MKTIAFVFALCMLTVGLVGVLSPPLLLPIARLSIESGAFLVLAAIRLGFGLLLIEVASRSRMPRTVRTIGILIAALGVVTALTAFLAMDHARALIVQWTQAGDGIMRLTGVGLTVFGGFLVYCLAPARAPGSTSS